MRRHLTSLTAAALLGLVFAASPAAADDSLEEDIENKGAEAMEMAETAMRQLMTALDLLLATIPQYEMPEVMDNGDIIIRRVQPEPDPDDLNDDGIPETAI